MPSLTPPITDNDHRQGDPKAPIQLVEYGDFQCPYCGQAYPITKHIQQTMGDKLLFVFREFPLEEHEYAMLAAETAEAAGAQGKFWPMHDMLYEHQDALTLSDMLSYGRQLGLDVQQLEEAVTKHTYQGKVEEEVQSGLQSGVNGTPTFFINGQRYDGSWEYQDLLQALHETGGVYAG